MEESEILKKLLIDEKTALRKIEEMVNKAQRIFKIRKESGAIEFEVADLTDAQMVGALLCGKYFAKRLKVIDSDALSLSEIAEQLHRPKTSLSGDIGQLVTRGWIEKDRRTRKYNVVYYHIDDILNDIMSRIGRRERRSGNA